MQTTLARHANIAARSKGVAAKGHVAPSRGGIVARRGVVGRRNNGMAVVSAGLNDNIFVNAVASAVTVAIPVAISVVTAEKSDDEFSRLQTPAGYIPIAAAVAADAVAHSIPGELFFCFLVISIDTSEKRARFLSPLIKERTYVSSGDGFVGRRARKCVGLRGLVI